jgi:6-phosphogluconolactonase (cycloisomerase 2 family)
LKEHAKNNKIIMKKTLLVGCDTEHCEYGLYIYNIDSDKITHVSSIKCVCIAYCAVSRDKQTLYAVQVIHNYYRSTYQLQETKENHDNALLAFHVDNWTSGQLTLIDTYDTGGSRACYLEFIDKVNTVMGM